MVADNETLHIVRVVLEDSSQGGYTLEGAVITWKICPSTYGSYLSYTHGSDDDPLAPLFT